MQTADLIAFGEQMTASVERVMPHSDAEGPEERAGLARVEAMRWLASITGNSLQKRGFPPMVPLDAVWGLAGKGRDRTPDDWLADCPEGALGDDVARLNGQIWATGWAPFLYLTWASDEVAAFLDRMGAGPLH